MNATLVDLSGPEPAPVPPPYFPALVAAETSGDATDADLAILRAHPTRWVDVLYQLLDDTEEALASVRTIKGEERGQIVADFEGERARIGATLTRLTGVEFTFEEAPAAPADARAEPVAPTEPEQEPGTTLLQLSWMAGRVVAWAAGPGAPAAPADELPALLRAAAAPAAGWTEHRQVSLPGGGRADALTVPIANVLGWLVAVGADGSSDAVGASVKWLGRVAIVAVRCVAKGRVVPLLRQVKRDRAAAKSSPDAGSFAVRWEPALLDGEELEALARDLPGSVSVFETAADPLNVARGAIADMVNAICRNAASRLEVPAGPPQPRTVAEVAEAFLSSLDGTTIDAPVRSGAELSGRMERWARSLTQVTPVQLIVQLDPPGDEGGWHLSVQASGVDRRPVPVEVALVSAPDNRRREVAEHLARLERLLPVVRRPGGQRRGEVMLSQDEAWDLMSTTGDTLVLAGFDVRVPAFARRRPAPALRLFADTSTPSVVGAHQLAAVRWSAVFDDVELDAAEIARLAAQARPMVKSRGRWVALDHADLAEAAAALAERAHTRQLTGAEMLRHAVGLEGTGLRGGISVVGNSWASNLLHQASELRAEPAPTPDGFDGTLRSYQAEALAWLGFIDSAGLGGCLALDMGLGKTPTLLAHLQATVGTGRSLIIAPPAVVGNWAAEAARFTPNLRVIVHHGPNRAEPEELAAEVADADVVLTTYGTAVRDIEALVSLPWRRMVLDEAQVIKNHLSETARQLRRVPANSKVALTGTPIENGLGDLWAILDFTNPGLVGGRTAFVAQLSTEGDTRAAAESALRALNGILVFRRTKSEPEIAAELPDRIDQLDHCGMTTEQIGLYQAVLDQLITGSGDGTPEGATEARKGQVLAAITALKQICNHPAAYRNNDDGSELAGRSGKLTRLEEIVDAVFAAGERVLIFTHFAEWGQKLAVHLTARYAMPIECYHGGLSRLARDQIIADFQAGEGAGALVLSLKAGGTGLNLTAASHVVLYDRWWNPAVEDQARDRAWRIGQERTVICHRLVCPGTVDERVEEVVMGKRRIAELVLPKSSSLGDLDAAQLRVALGLRPDAVIAEDASTPSEDATHAA